MSRPTSKDDQPILLCEDCGYAINGIPADQVCPECGREIARSLPSHRTGSAWQVKPGLGAWFRTLRSLSTQPRQEFSRIRPETSWTLLVTNLALSATIFMPSVVIQQSLSRNQLPDHAEIFASMFHGLSFGLLVSAIYLGLTTIEVIGVRFWSRRLGRRLPVRVILGVCAHASFAWLAAAFLSGLGWAIAPRAHLLLPNNPSQWFSLPVGLAILVGAGSLIGMVLFETLVYLGVRRCRYINVPTETRSAESPEDQQRSAESSEPARTESKLRSTPHPEH